MYKICVGLVTVLAIAAAKPSVGYPYSAYPTAYDVANAAYTYSAPAVYPSQSVYSPSYYTQSYPASYSASYPASYSASYPVTYASAPVTSYVSPSVASYAAPIAAYTAGSVAADFAYPAYSGSYDQSVYPAGLTYGSNYGGLPLWKKK